ncbi:sugar ABC transporter substrate-binding protein [Lacrimispora indolis]|uniref:sugar ABC transporter substrate-binding protein n=1 Tax=Lacrimispora indolis TaxID=69825 RepID=UPI0004275B60|nr:MULTISPECIES: sugar ABC transporter substrate-binding protein [Lachnospiraceae]MBE7720544.1 sugar ABC transporter substrate-binding protein [Lacrimispora celerecrescens]
MRKVTAIVLSAMMALSLSACGSSAKETTAVETTSAVAGVETTAGKTEDTKEPIKIGVSAPDLTNVFFIQIKDAMQAALTGPEDELIIQDAGGDQNKQMNDVADMINQGVDVICISAINSEGVRATLEACKEADIPVIAFNTSVKNPELVQCTVVSDNKEAGKLCAQALADSLGGKGKVVEITYSTTEVCYDRQLGFEEELKKYPDIEIIQTKDVEKPKSDYSQPIMVDFINANPVIDGVFTINDPTARGAIAALKEAGRLDATKVVSVDGSDEGKGFIRADEMVASAAQDPAGIGTTCIETAYRLLSGQTIEEKVVVPMSIITKENVDQ